MEFSRYFNGGKGREAAISKKELRESIITISPIFGEKPPVRMMSSRLLTAVAPLCGV